MVIHMVKHDARKLTATQLTELRKRAVTAVQNGESPEVVARSLCINRVTIYGWLARYRAGGISALNASKRGGRKPKVKGSMLRWVYNAVTMKNPEQFQFQFALWTSKMLAKIIQQRFGIQLSKASVCRLLNQLGLSAQKPLWRAWQQDSDRVEKWLNEEFPAIAKRAKKEAGVVWFGDEAGLRSDAHSGKTWAKKGETPVVRTTGARFGINLISAVNRLGELRFMCVEGRVNADVFIEFLERLIAGTQRKVFFVVDGHPSHKAKKVSTFVEAHKDRIELFFLPPYSPELNPDELVWNDLKNNGVGRTAISGPDMLKRTAVNYLRKLQKLPERVASYFKAPDTKYACV
jgi:transposase